MKKVLVGMFALVMCVGMAMAQTNTNNSGIDWNAYNKRTEAWNRQQQAKKQQEEEAKKQERLQRQEETRQRKLEEAYLTGREQGTNTANGTSSSGNTCSSEFKAIEERKQCDDGFDYGYQKTMNAKKNNNN